ncbi:glycerate kinase type-2 family protein [Stetteria hydrogenophila]
MESSPLEDARSLVGVVLEASRVEERVRAFIEASGIPGEARGRVILLALGKSAPSMARGALKALGRVDGGVVATQRGVDASGLDGLEVVYGDHPLPGESSVRAGEALLEWARGAGSGDLILALVSGGGSAIAEVPMEPLTLEDLREAYRVLLDSGAPIDEVNTVRKHLSKVKGGRLAAARGRGSRLVGLYASDVPGDRLDLIASGPTVPDPSSYRDALRVIELRGLRDRLPGRVVRLLEAGARGEVPETPKPGDPAFQGVSNELAASNIDVLRAMARFLEGRGYRVVTLTSRLEGEARELGFFLASVSLDALHRGIPAEPPLALLAGGEATVTVTGERGRGGRNTELALAWALRMNYWGAPRGRAAILSMDTDGIDGDSPAAGAVAAPELIDEAVGAGLDPWLSLYRHDSYTLLSRLGATVETGPTGSNLNSVTAVLLR